jgi:GH24 family phage-related lysozyme (muramidase)
MELLKGSVGRDGTNRPNDVTLVQSLLNRSKNFNETPPLAVDGIIGPKTKSRIESYQIKLLSMNNPDGRVDPNGKTFMKLINNRLTAKTASTLSFSTKGINLLKSIEGLETKPYDDQTGKTITKWVEGATIGIGHLISQTEWNKYKNGITESEAITLFKADLQPYSNKVKTTIKTNITQNEFDALVIFTFNIGKSAFANSSVVKMINDPKRKTGYNSLEQAWKAWNKSQGKINKGLQNRRKAEWDIFTKGIYKTW